MNEFFSLLFLFIGYAFGRMSNKTIEESVREAKNGVKAILPDQTIKPGIIKRPSAQELHRRNLPEYKKQEHNAVKETLDGVPDLVKAKEYLKLHPELKGK